MMMEQKVNIKTFKIGKIGARRYLHQIEVPGKGYFHVVTDSDYFSMTSRTIIRNKVLTKLSGNETRGLRFVREERGEWLNNDSWLSLCFGGEDMMELRKKIYGKELRKIELEMLVYPRSKRVEIIKKKGGDDMIPGRSAWFKGRNLRKRIKDPLPYIVLERVKYMGEKPILLSYTVNELSYLMFKRRVNDWYG